MRRMASESRRSQMLRGVLDLCLLAVVVDEPAVVTALRELPPRTRAVTVLRCYEQRPVEEVARVELSPELIARLRALP
jgi:DNA-directed RNA polymerase specialized sigma24 family protein